MSPDAAASKQSTTLSVFAFFLKKSGSPYVFSSFAAAPVETDKIGVVLNDAAVDRPTFTLSLWPSVNVWLPSALNDALSRLVVFSGMRCVSLRLPVSTATSPLPASRNGRSFFFSDSVATDHSFALRQSRYREVQST